jgi:allantoin racemase
MKILIINPNTSESLTDLLAGTMRRYARPDVEITGMTAKIGVPYIATRAEAVVGANAVLQILAEHHMGYDGAVIAAFGDPGLGAAREMFDIPIVGMAEAGMLTACMLGQSFGIVTFATALGPWYKECVDWHKLGARLAGISMADEPFDEIENVRHEKESLIVKLANRAVDCHGADVVVLAGAPLTGLAEEISEQIPVPVIDCAAAAISQVDLLVRLQLRVPRKGTFRRPCAKQTIGLPEPLAARFEGRR